MRMIDGSQLKRVAFLINPLSGTFLSFSEIFPSGRELAAA